MWIANVNSMEVQPLSVLPERPLRSNCVRYFETEHQAKTWLGGTLSHELCVKMTHCDRLIAAIERLSQ